MPTMRSFIILVLLAVVAALGISIWFEPESTPMAQTEAHPMAQTEAR